MRERIKRPTPLQVLDTLGRFKYNWDVLSLSMLVARAELLKLSGCMYQAL